MKILKTAGLSFFLSLFFVSLVSAKTVPYKTKTPEGYELVPWASARGITSFVKAPEGNGYLDFLTVIYLPYNQIKFITTSTPKIDWGGSKFPSAILPTTTVENIPNNFFVEETTTTLEDVSVTTTAATSTIESVSTTVRDWAFTKFQVEQAKAQNKNAKFIWNVPFFNVELPVSDLSLGLKSSDADGDYITSGSRPVYDVAQPRKMLIINNKAGTSTIQEFNEDVFVSDGDQAVEVFDSMNTNKGSDADIARLFVGVKSNGKELVIYCSKGATPSEAREALAAAGVSPENMMQADGGTSATCAYNMIGQYFVEPGRTLPHLMGAFPLVGRGTVITEGLNVRNAANTKGKVLRKLKSKEQVVLYEAKNGWYRISESDEWVSTGYIKLIAE